jgi:hypothetical protein
MQQTLCPWKLNPILSFSAVSTNWQNHSRGRQQRLPTTTANISTAASRHLKVGSCTAHDTPTPRPFLSVFFFRAGTMPSAASASSLGPAQLHRIVAVRPPVPLTTHQVQLKAKRREALCQYLRAHPGLSAAHIWNRYRCANRDIGLNTCGAKEGGEALFSFKSVSLSIRAAETPAVAWVQHSSASLAAS